MGLGQIVNRVAKLRHDLDLELMFYNEGQHDSILTTQGQVSSRPRKTPRKLKHTISPPPPPLGDMIVLT